MFRNLKKTEIKQVNGERANNMKIAELFSDDVLLISGGGCEIAGQTCHLDGHTVRCESYSVVCN